MSFIYFIRHAQASATKEDYDQLSEKGYQQGKALQQALSSKEIAKIYVGPCKRHWQTYTAAAQPHWPEAIRSPLLDEFPAHDLIQKGLDPLLKKEPKFAPIADNFRSQVGTASKSYSILLQRLTYLWLHDELELEGVESALQYQQRLMKIIIELNEKQNGLQLVFTSAGTIANIVGILLQGDPALSIRIAWMLYNTSITTAKAAPQLPILSAMNWIDHIPKNLRTFL